MAKSEHRRALHLQALGRFVLLLAIPVLIGFVMWLVALHAQQRGSLVRHTLLVEVSLERLLSDVKSAESNQRDFLLTGIPEFREAYLAGAQAAQGEIEQLARLNAENQNQLATLSRLRMLLDRLFTSLATPLAENGVRSRSGLAARAAGIEVKGELLGPIQTLVNDMLQEQERLLHQEEDAQAAGVRQFYWWLFIGYGLIVLIVASLYRSVKRHSMLSAQAERRLAVLNAELDQRIQQRTALLRAREELLTMFVRHVPASVVMLDKELRVLEVSDRYCTEFGVDRDQMTGRRPTEIFSDYPDRWMALLERCLMGESLRAEEDPWDHDGKVLWSRWEIRPWGSANGLPEGVLVFSENITARKEMEDALRAREELLTIFVRHVPVAVAMMDREMRYLQVSDRWCLENGFAREHVIGRSHYELVSNLPDRWKEAHKRCLQGETLCSDEDSWERNGKVEWLRWEIRPWGMKDGAPEGIIFFTEDITARRGIEVALRESEATNRTLLDTASQAILAVDAKGTIVLANKMAGEIFGYASSELIGQHHEILMPPAVRERHQAHWAAFSADPKPRFGIHLIGVRKDGTEFPIEMSLSLLETTRGPLVVCFISDITVRKQAEAHLRESEERLRALAGSLLTAQEKERSSLARELHDGVTQKLAFLSIELGRLAGELPVSMSDVRTQLQSLQKQTLRESSEIRRISHGLHPSVISDFGLSVALEEFCEEFEKAQGVSVSFEGSLVDRQLKESEAACLYRIAQESMRNAAAHGRASQVRVTLQVADHQLRLRVQDNGMGFRVDEARIRKGLGIISMRERARLVNGILQLLSEPGQGTTVIASIPITENHG